MKRYLIVFISLISVFGQEIGEICLIQKTGSRGVCKVGNNCEFATEQAKHGITPQLCGFHNNMIPIFCCPINDRNPQPNENSLLEDRFIFQNDDEPISPSKKRISELKCMEYTKPLTVTVQAAPLITHPEDHITSINVANCSNDGIPLIIGGTAATAGEFPFMAAIGYFGDEGNIEWKCGGTLISDYYILTAAHCISSQFRGRPQRVKLGSVNLERTDDGIDGSEYRIERAIVHEQYRPPVTYNDIALIKLTSRVIFSDQVRPACVWPNYDIEQNKTIATGWGKTGFANDLSSKLLKVSLFVYDNYVCQTKYKSDRKVLPYGISRSTMCAGDLQGGKDTCQGDSGGPLLTTTKDNSCLFYVVGITSFGKACGVRESPAVYTRVSDYVGWIEDKIW